MGNGEKLQRLMPLLLLLLVVFVFSINIFMIWGVYSLSRTRSSVVDLTTNHIPHILEVIEELDKRTGNLEKDVRGVQNKISAFEISLNNYLNEMRKERKDFQQEQKDFQQQIRKDVRDEIQKALPSKDQ